MKDRMDVLSKAGEMKEWSDGMSEGQERESKRTDVIDVIQLVRRSLMHTDRSVRSCVCAFMHQSLCLHSISLTAGSEITIDLRV